MRIETIEEERKRLTPTVVDTPWNPRSAWYIAYRAARSGYGLEFARKFFPETLVLAYKTWKLR